MNVKVLRQRVSDLKGQILAAKQAKLEIGAASITENRALTADERTKASEAATKIQALETQLVDAEALLVDAEAALEAERAYTPATPAPAPAPAPAADPADSAASRDAAAAARIPRVVVTGPEARPGYFGRQMQAVRNFAINGGAAHTSAEDMAVLRPIMAAPTGMNTDVPSEGGFLVAPERSTTIIQRAYEVGELLSRVNRMPIGPGSNGMKMPAIDETSRADGSRYGGIASGWLGQGNTLTAGKPKFREIDLKLRKVGAFVYATDEQLADSIALEAWINKYLPLELKFRVEDAVANGLGGNQPLGYMKSPALISVTRSIAAHVTADDVRNMYYRMWAPLRSSAVFLIDQAVEADMEQGFIAIGTGGVLDPSYKPAGSVPGQKFSTYKNIPIIPVEYAAALGTAGDIALVSLPEYLLIDKGDVQQAVSLHVAFLTDEAVYRFLYRVDGQMSWDTTLTPKSGGATLGPVIALT